MSQMPALEEAASGGGEESGAGKGEGSGDVEGGGEAEGEGGASGDADVGGDGVGREWRRRWEAGIGGHSIDCYRRGRL